MTPARRKVLVVLALLAISAVAFIVPYSFDPTCRTTTPMGMAVCFFRNAGVTIFRWLPIGFAILLALAPAKRRHR
jgi:hypothetical protein